MASNFNENFSDLLTDAVRCVRLEVASRIPSWSYEKSDGILSIDFHTHSMCLEKSAKVHNRIEKLLLFKLIAK